MARMSSAMLVALVALGAVGTFAQNMTDNVTMTTTTPPVTDSPAPAPAPDAAPAPAPEDVPAPAPSEPAPETSTVIEGSLTMTVSDVDPFINSNAAVAGVEKGIATAANIPASYVEATLSAGSRRLQRQQNRRLASGSVVVTYTITIPTSDSTNTATAIVSTLSSQSTSDMTALIETAVSEEGVSGITVSVTTIATPEVTQSGTHPKTTDSLARRKVAFASVHFILLVVPVAWFLA
jgi:hypothetical protein